MDVLPGLPPQPWHQMFISFLHLMKSCEPWSCFSVLTRFSDSPQLLLSDDTWVCWFSFSGSCLGPHFHVLASLDDILQIAPPSVLIQMFPNSPRHRLSGDTKVYGFLINGSLSGPHSVVISSTTTLSTGLFPGTKPLGELSMDKRPFKMTAE